MNPDSSTSPSSESATVARFDSYRSLLRQRRRETALVSLGAFAIVCGFVYACWATLQTNFSRDKVVAHAQKTAESLVREASPALMQVARDVVPVYRDEAQRAIDETLPELRERFADEARSAASHIAKTSEASLNEATMGALDPTIQQLSQRFPSLTDETFRSELVDEAHQALHRELEGLLHETSELYQAQADQVLASMQSFENPHAPQRSADELTQRFMHLWLVLIDDQIMRGSSDVRLGDVSKPISTDGVRGG